MSNRNSNHAAADAVPTLVQAAATELPQGYVLVRADTRGGADHGWLRSRHTFSFAGYYDPNRMGFSALRVINEDRVQPGGGFGTHPHSDMEILSYVLEGSLQHRDSMGNGTIIRPGDVQLMSAGKGIAHSEFNPSTEEPVHFLQIWLIPEETGGKPSYQQRPFTEAEKRGKFALVLSRDGALGSLRIKQDAKVYAGLFNGTENATLQLGADRLAYIHIARGTVSLNSVPLQAGDGVAVQLPGQTLAFSKGTDAEVLIFDLPPTT